MKKLLLITACVAGLTAGSAQAASVNRDQLVKINNSLTVAITTLDKALDIAKELGLKGALVDKAEKTMKEAKDSHKKINLCWNISLKKPDGIVNTSSCVDGIQQATILAAELLKEAAELAKSQGSAAINKLKNLF